MPAIFSISQIPFSHPGSYLAFSRWSADVRAPGGLFMRSIRRPFATDAIFRIELTIDGAVIPFTEHPTPECLLLCAEGERNVAIAFDGADAVRFRLHGVGVRLIPMPTVELQVAPSADAWRMLVDDRLWMTIPLRGALAVVAPWNGVGNSSLLIDCIPDSADDVAEFAILDVAPEWDGARPTRPFDACVDDAHAQFQAFLARQLPCHPEFAAAHAMATYLNWSALVNPAGYLKRPTMYVSKNWMCGSWSWDHCFNAIALAKSLPEMAWDQFMTPFDQQSAQGALPDLVQDAHIFYNYVKPPIHGWALAKMMALNPTLLTSERLSLAYEHLTRLTRYWQQYRDPFATGLPVYWHGNDSGWDNATVFLAGSPLTGPECAAYLVLQMEVLADLADRLGKTVEAREWRASAETLQTRLISQLWRGDRFAMPTASDGREAPAGADSLLPYLTIILGERLPEEIRAPLLAGLTHAGRFLTDWGLATESRQSPFYQDDGYWRGPIWASATMLLIDGLQRSGAQALATELKRRFCTLCVRQGFAENFDAVTGEGLRDRAYTWTASVFLVLANELSVE